MVAQRRGSSRSWGAATSGWKVDGCATRVPERRRRENWAGRMQLALPWSTGAADAIGSALSYGLRPPQLLPVEPASAPRAPTAVLSSAA